MNDSHAKRFFLVLSVFSMWVAIIIVLIAGMALYYFVPNASNTVWAITLISAIIISPIIVLLLGSIFRDKTTDR